MRRPFFSILIPTYNRSSTLKCAIESVLLQSFDDFEIIVIDDCSPDDTQEVVKSFQDKRIRYYRNKKNLGTEGNIKKAFSYPKGEYIFTIGDDDFVLFADTLAYIKNILDKKPLGFIRLNLIEKKFIGEGLRKSIVNVEDDIFIKKNADPLTILNFSNRVAIGHYAGLVIKNRANLSSKMIGDRETPWIKIIFEATKKDGALFLGKHYMIITWSQAGILTHYDVPENKRLMFEGYTDFIFRLVPKNKLEEYKHNFYKKFVILQPVIKLYSNNKNLLKFDKKLFQLDPSLKTNPWLYVFLLVALILPKPFWELARVIQHRFKNTLPKLKNLDRIYQRYRYLENHFQQMGK